MAAPDSQTGAEAARLIEARDALVPWRKWGPYLSERQWGTVREDYSANGDAWSYFSIKSSCCLPKSSSTRVSADT